MSSSSRLSPEQLSDARTGKSTVIYSGGVRDEGVMRDGEGRGRSDERWGGMAGGVMRDGEGRERSDERWRAKSGKVRKRGEY